jgi:short-subunit dehydrogenase
MKTQDWTDRRVWIVGASTGIGRATAELLLQRGATVGISARSADKLASLATQYPRAIVLPVDTNHVEQLQEAYHRLTEYGALDVYLHCAADYQPMRAWELDPIRMQQMMNTNYGGVLNGLSVVLPDMLTRQAGHLAIVASVAGYMGLPKSLAYGPTKAALINLCESLYVDLKPKGVGVQVINPGFVETPLTAQNDFDMPALLTPAQAAQALVKDLATDQFEITFPKRFTYALKFVKRLPYPIQLQILSKIAQNS